MLPIALIFSVLGWTAFAMIAIGVCFWALRWFPNQPWFARAMVAVFVALALAARETKWAIPMLALLLVAGSAFIPRKR